MAWYGKGPFENYVDRCAGSRIGIYSNTVDGLFVKVPTSRFESMYGQKVAEAISMLLYTRKAAAPVVRKIIESALANARVQNPSVDVDGLYVSIGSVDKGPNSNLRRWRPRAMGRATQITKGVSHIAITLTDRPPPAKKKPVAKKSAGETPDSVSQE